MIREYSSKWGITPGQSRGYTAKVSDLGISMLGYDGKTYVYPGDISDAQARYILGRAQELNQWEQPNKALQIAIPKESKP